MKAAFQLALLLTFVVSATAFAQRPQPTNQTNTQGGGNYTLPGAGNDPDNVQPQGDFVPPMNDIVEAKAVVQNRILPYEHLREADIMWKRRVWRVIDVKEKINLPFINPQRPLITILLEAAQSGDLRVFDPIGGDNFSMLMSDSTLADLAGGTETYTITDPDTYEPIVVTEERIFDPETVRRYRIQEMWYFDRESSVMKVRILGIAPMLMESTETNGQTIERPMFWVYYPEARQLLANEQAFAYGNDAANRNWETVFEARYFNSYITKASNVTDSKIASPEKSGRAQLREAEKIKQEIFNYEQDLWSY